VHAELWRTKNMDRSLDEIIQQNKSFRPRGGRGGGGRDTRSAGGALRRARNTNRSAPYRASRAVQEEGRSSSQWQHDRFDEAESVGEDFDSFNSTPGIETGTKLLVANLDYNVIDDDIKDLFESIGDVKKAFVHYDKSGRSLGNATIVYARRSDAVAGLKKYNGVPLDGKPMKITLVGTNVHAPGTFEDEGNNNARSLRSAVREADFTVSFGGLRSNRRVVARGGGRSRRIVTVGGRFGGAATGAGRRGRGRGRGRQVGFTREQLDADLDAYGQERVDD